MAIKTFEQFNINDPYDEEDWNDDTLFDKGDLIIAKKSQFKKRKNGIVERIVKGDTYRISNVGFYRMGTKYHVIIVPGILTPQAVFGVEQMKEYFDKKIDL